MLESYAEKIPLYLNNVIQALDPHKFSFKFGVMAYGGRLSHTRPHAITLDGQLMNDLPIVKYAFEHLKFAGVESQNDSSDALAAISKAAYLYPFRPGRFNSNLNGSINGTRNESLVQGFQASEQILNKNITRTGCSTVNVSLVRRANFPSNS